MAQGGRKKWLKDAIRHPGSFSDWCKRRGYREVTRSCISEAKRIASERKDRSLLGKATLAERLKYGDLAKSKKRRRKRR